MFALISAYPNENVGHNVYEWFSGTEKVMFTLDYDIYESGRTTKKYDCENITIVNEALNGATIDQGYFLYYLPEHYKELGIDGIDPEIIKFIHPNLNNNKATDEFINTMMTNLEIADMYLALVPKQYRVTAAELDPNNLVEEGKVLVK